MGEPGDGSSRLDPAQTRRMLSAISLRPNERILCLGPAGGTLPGVAAVLFGPSGRIVEGDTATLAADETLAYPDGEFDAVIIDLTVPYPKQTQHLLAEAARVTAPTGRVALAVPHAGDGDSVPVQQLAEKAGLRGVAVRPDPVTDSESEPVDFVTAFPPAPVEPAADTESTAEIHLPKPAAKPARFRRRPLVLVAAGALVAAAAIGVIWGLAGAEPDEDVPGEADFLAGDTELDVDQPGTQEQSAADDPPAGGGLSTNDSGTGGGSSGSASGTGTGSGGGQPSNLPPVIDSPGLSSNGLVLTIAPEVSDPDSDDVTLLFDVDGMKVDPAQTCSTLTCKGEEQPGDFPDRAAVLLDFADVGYAADVAVTITATDSHGATSRETYTHAVSARTLVTFRDFNYAISDPSACFSAKESRVLSFTLGLDGASAHRGSSDHTVSSSNANGTLDIDRAAGWHGKPPPPLEVSLSISLSGIGTTAFAAPRSYSNDAEETVNIGRGTPCEGAVTYRVTFETF